MPFDPNILLYTPIALILIVLIWVIRMEIRLNRLLKGKNAKTLEDTILVIDRQLKDTQTFESEMEKYLTSVEERLRQSAQAVATVRFNAFVGTGEGGKQSFATAIINEHGDGVVFSSIYSRERVGAFSKPIEKFASEYELSKEEKESVTKAKALLKPKNP